MKLNPIEKPNSLYVKLAYAISKKQYGEVITPMKVIYARKPALLGFMQKLFRVDGKSAVPPYLKEMTRNYIARKNGCEFCDDISRMRSLDQEAAKAKLTDLMSFQTSEQFTEKEKAALAYVDEMVENNGATTGDAFAELSKHFSEEAVIDITWICATETYMNFMNRAFDIGSDGFCSL